MSQDLTIQYEIIKADLKKVRQEVLGIWKEDLANNPEARYAWIYEGNPLGPASCWLVKETIGKKVIGSAALFPRRIWVRGVPRMAAIAGDFAIAKAHRGYGPALALQRMITSSARAASFDLVYGMPIRQAELVCRRAGYKVVGNVVRMAKVLRTKDYIQRLGVPGIASILSTPVDFAMKFLSKESYSKDVGDCTLQQLTCFDQRFDVLWEKVSSGYQIIGERKSDYLNWRFVQSPQRHYSVFALISNGTDEALGYVVSETAQGMTTIIDLLVIDMGESLDTLLSKFIRLQRESGIHAISIRYFGDDTLFSRLKTFGFLIRDSELAVVVYVEPDLPWSSCVTEKKNWYLLDGDFDG